MIITKNSEQGNKRMHSQVIIMMKKYICIAVLLCFAIGALAQKQRVMNKPYIDNRKLHWGFCLGMNFMDMELTNNGIVDPETGEQWFTDVTRYSPGFTVGILGALRLNKYMELRLTPTMHFGQKYLKMQDNVSLRDTSQTMRTNYVSVPISLKFAAPRYNNFRPYFTFGLAPTFCLNKHDQEPFAGKMFDCYIELGMGCDIYLPYFKLIPELKFCFGLADIIRHTRDDLLDKGMMKFTNSVDRGCAKMIVLSLYFE